MSNILQIQAKDVVVRINQFDVLNGVQDFDWEPNFNEEFIEELGNEAYAGMRITPDVSGSFSVTSVGATSSILGRMVFEYDSTGEFDGPRGPDNDSLFRESDFERAVFEFIESKKANEVFDRSTIIHRAHLSSLSLSATADGVASETYSFEGDVAEVYVRPMHDLISIPVHRVSSDSVMASPEYDFGEGGDWTIHYLLIGEQVIPADQLTLDEDEIIVTGATVPVGARTVVIAYASNPGEFPTISYPTSARFIPGDQIDLWLIPKSTMNIENMLGTTNLNNITFSDTDHFLRAQSQDINVDLGLEALRQIKMNRLGTTIYTRQPTYPLNITSSLTVYETDLSDWAKIQGKAGMGSSSPDVLNLSDFAGTEFQLVRRDYINSEPVQTVAILDARVDGRGSRISVGGRSEISWSFAGSKIAIQGVEGM